MQEQRGLGRLRFVNALRKDLTSHLPEMARMLEEAISDEVSKEITRCKIVDRSLRDRLRPGVDNPPYLSKLRPHLPLPIPLFSLNPHSRKIRFRRCIQRRIPLEKVCRPQMQLCDLHWPVPLSAPHSTIIIITGQSTKSSHADRQGLEKPLPPPHFPASIRLPPPPPQTPENGNELT